MRSMAKRSTASNLIQNPKGVVGSVAVEEVIMVATEGVMAAATEVAMEDTVDTKAVVMVAKEATAVVGDMVIKESAFLFYLSLTLKINSKPFI